MPKIRYRRDLDKSKCKNKQSFKEYKDALAFAEDYMIKIPLTFHPMVPYWCERHSIWHIGHDSFKKREYNLGVLSDGDGQNIL